MDWTKIPLVDFFEAFANREERPGLLTAYPHGDGVPQRLMVRIQVDVEDAYENLLSYEDGERFRTTDEVPVIRDGRRGYEPFDSLTLADLPAILDTLAVMDEEAKAMGAEEAARLDAERKRRRNARTRERRKLKKLGEWE